ncbi:MAG: oxidoreductase [Candidatus Eremiobacteraeota bacterium]|nr:oxidoreductase [Candidatus Eremiobacteraeota bacterium]
MAEKLKFAFYWAASCGGCEVAVLDIDAKLLDVVKVADIVFWPCAMDFKYKDVEAMEDDYIDVCFYNGAVRNSEQEYLAHLLRRKSRVMVAFGSCACFGGIPGLANLFTKDEIMSRQYLETPTTVNPDRILPQPSYQAPEGELTIPVFYDEVKALGQVVPVDYYIPGCPPPPDLIVAAVEAIATGNLPPAPAVIAGNKTVCDECPREKAEKIVAEFKRVHEVIPDEKTCLLEQGIICCGPGTRSGCGAQCLQVNMPCRGCFGPPEHVTDQGAKLLSAITSIMDADDPEQVEIITESIPDPAGTFYRFALPVSLLEKIHVAEVK